MTLSSPIQTLLLMLLANDEIVGSWGITDIEISFNSISFNVNGFLYVGRVLIFPNDSNLYTIELSTQTFEHIELDRVVQVLDSEIEKSEDYIQELTLWIKNRLT